MMWSDSWKAWRKTANPQQEKQLTVKPQKSSPDRCQHHPKVQSGLRSCRYPLDLKQCIHSESPCWEERPAHKLKIEISWCPCPIGTGKTYSLYVFLFYIHIINQKHLLTRRVHSNNTFYFPEPHYQTREHNRGNTYLPRGKEHGIVIKF